MCRCLQKRRVRLRFRRSLLTLAAGAAAADGRARVAPPQCAQLEAAQCHAADEVPTKRLTALLATLSKEVAEHTTQRPLHMADLQAAVAALDAAVTQHFAALEAVPLARLRQLYTREETKWSLEKHMVEDEGKSQDIGWLLTRGFATDAARDAWMHKVPEMSSTKRTEAIAEAHSYAKHTQQLILDIIIGKHAVPDDGCCVIS